MPEDWKSGGFGIYLHWPFCQSKCPYCDFNSHVVKKIDTERWRRAYITEIDRHAALTPGRILTSVFFGGGTPSLMPPDLVASIMDRIRKHWPTVNDFEVTLEANPTSVEMGKFRAFAEAGVNRVSLGIQAMNDRDLKRLGRIHSASEALSAFDIARRQFDRVSFDLIYARQDQTLDAWRAELGMALGLAVDHLSLYQLTIEPQTAFGDLYKVGKLRGLPDDDRAADMYEMTQEMADSAGFSSYEVSNLARPGAESRHNSVYWRYGDYIGIGPGAHGRLTLNGKRHATEARRMPDAWLRDVEAGSGTDGLVPLTNRDQVFEYLTMGLRLSDGIVFERINALQGKPLDPAKIAELHGLGMITITESHLRATSKGRLVLNSVIRHLAPDQ